MEALLVVGRRLGLARDRLEAGHRAGEVVPALGEERAEVVSGADALGTAREVGKAAPRSDLLGDRPAGQELDAGARARDVAGIGRERAAIRLERALLLAACGAERSEPAPEGGALGAMQMPVERLERAPEVVAPAEALLEAGGVTERPDVVRGGRDEPLVPAERALGAALLLVDPRELADQEGEAPAVAGGRRLALEGLEDRVVVAERERDAFETLARLGAIRVERERRLEALARALDVFEVLELEGAARAVEGHG